MELAGSRPLGGTPRRRLQQRGGLPVGSCCHFSASCAARPDLRRNPGVHQGLRFTRPPWDPAGLGAGLPTFTSSWTRAVCRGGMAAGVWSPRSLGSGVSASGWCSQLRTLASRSCFHGDSPKRGTHPSSQPPAGERGQFRKMETQVQQLHVCCFCCGIKNFLPASINTNTNASRGRVFSRK